MRELITNERCRKLLLELYIKLGVAKAAERRRIFPSRLISLSFCCVTLSVSRTRKARKRAPADEKKTTYPKCIQHFKKAALARQRDKSQHLIQFKKFYFIPFLAPLPTFGCACKYFKLSPQIPTLRSDTRARAPPCKTFPAYCFFLFCCQLI